MTPPPPPRPGSRRRGDDELAPTSAAPSAPCPHRGKRKRRAALVFVTLLVIVLAVFASASAPSPGTAPTAPVVCSRSRSARTRSSTPPTARCSARSRPRRTAAGALWRVSPWMPQGDGFDRGQALLAARRRRPRGHHARALGGRQRGQGRAGRLDDHAAARAQPLHLERADAEAEAEGGLPRDEALAAGRRRGSSRRT